MFFSNTIKGADGNDLLSFTNQTTAATIRAISNSAGTAGSLKAIYSGAYESAGGIAESSSLLRPPSPPASRLRFQHLFDPSADWSANCSYQFIVRCWPRRRLHLLGDQVTTFNDVSVRGGKGNDVLGTFNSGGANTGILSQLSGGEIKGGAGSGTVYVNLSGESATDFKLVGNTGN